MARRTRALYLTGPCFLGLCIKHVLGSPHSFSGEQAGRLQLKSHKYGSIKHNAGGSCSTGPATCHQIFEGQQGDEHASLGSQQRIQALNNVTRREPCTVRFTQGCQVHADASHSPGFPTLQCRKPFATWAHKARPGLLRKQCGDEDWSIFTLPLAV